MWSKRNRLTKISKKAKVNSTVDATVLFEYFTSSPISSSSRTLNNAVGLHTRAGLDKAHKESELLQTVLFFCRERGCLTKEFNTVDSSCHPVCMMKCSQCLKNLPFHVCHPGKSSTICQNSPAVLLCIGHYFHHYGRKTVSVWIKRIGCRNFIRLSSSCSYLC